MLTLCELPVRKIADAMNFLTACKGIYTDHIIGLKCVYVHVK